MDSLHFEFPRFTVRSCLKGSMAVMTVIDGEVEEDEEEQGQVGEASPKSPHPLKPQTYCLKPQNPLNLGV